jgi:hypothetical protein
MLLLWNKTMLGHVALGFPPEGGQPKRHVALDLLPLRYSPSTRWRLGLGNARHGPRLVLGQVGQDRKQHWVLAACEPSVTWCLGSSTPDRKHNVTWRLLCFLLRAAQAPRGAWAAYTFNIIASIGIKNIIISFLNILFLV